MYSFRRSDTKTPYTLDNIMAAKSGLEGRYASRFVKYAGTSQKSLTDIDTAGKVADNLHVSSSVIDTQTSNINLMFVVAEAVVKKINAFQAESGENQIQNIPLPTDLVRASYSKKMGYVKLVLEFVGEGLEHFMEQALNLEGALRNRDKVISEIAAYHREVEMVGELSEISLEDLAMPGPINIETYTSQPADPISPPVTPDSIKTKGKKALKK